MIYIVLTVFLWFEIDMIDFVDKFTIDLDKFKNDQSFTP
jgi:hypothetical protein